MIHWDQFDWQSFSTLVTGMAALCAAGFVGYRQLGIAERQIGIAERQIAVADMSIKVDLFERRMAAYQTTMLFLNAMMRNPLDDQYYTSYFAVFSNSRFLFRDEVFVKLSEVMRKSIEYHGLKRRMTEQSFELGRIADEDNLAEFTLLRWCTDEIDEIHKVFAPDLKLDRAYQM